MKLRYLSLFTIPVLGFAFIKEPSMLQTNAQTFVSSDWTLVAPNGVDPWAQKDGEALINTNEKWFPANYLLNKNTAGLNTTDDGRLAFQLTTAFHSETDAITLHSAQWRGFVLFYLDDNNWLTAGVKWDYSATDGKRADAEELQEMMIYGKIGGNFYQTWGTSSWTSKEYNDLWTDNCETHITEPMELIMQYTPAMEGNTINSDTDLITLTAKTANKTITKQQRLRSLSQDGYFDLNSNLSNMSSGLFSINVDATLHGDPVSFTQFEYTAIKPTFGDYEKITDGYLNSEITLPTVIASTPVENSLATAVSVKDPDDQPVVVTSNKFTPTKLGDYVVTYSAKDKFNSTGTDSYILHVQSGHLISVQGEKVTSGKIGDTITLPSFYVEEHPEIELNVTVTDPNGDNVAVTSNSFMASLEGDYVVRVTSSTPNVAPLQYRINIVDPNVPTYIIVESGERITSANVGSKVTIPTFSVEDHDEIGLTVTVIDPLEEEVTLYGNAFSATKAGTYKVNVHADSGKYNVEDIDYDIVVSNPENHDDDDKEEPRIPDPNIYNYAYGKRSAGIYLMLVGVAVGVSGISVGGFFLVKFIIKKKGKHE